MSNQCKPNEHEFQGAFCGHCGTEMPIPDQNCIDDPPIDDLELFNNDDPPSNNGPTEGEMD